MASALFILLNTLLVVSTYVASIYPTTQWTFTEGTANKPSTILTNSLQSPLDAVKFDFINGTSYQWWYFDVVSYDLQSSITFTFYIGSYVEPNNNPSEVPTYVGVDGKFPNDRLFSIPVIPVTDITINTVGQGSSSLWEGLASSCSWTGTADLSMYEITIAAPEYGVDGSIILNSLSPAAYPNNPASQQFYNVSEIVVDNFGWANAIPGAQELVNVTVNNTRIAFQGSGYHDTNWGTIPMAGFLEVEYWGHAQVGDWSIVFWLTQPLSGETISHIYIADGPSPLILGDVTITPMMGSDYPNGTISLDIDGGFDGRYEFTLLPEFITARTAPVYTRWIGKMEGGLFGGEKQTGVVLWEHFDFEV